MLGLPRLFNTTSINTPSVPSRTNNAPSGLPRLINNQPADVTVDQQPLPQSAEVSKLFFPFAQRAIARDASNVPVRNPGFYDAQVEDQYVYPTNEQLAALPPESMQDTTKTMRGEEYVPGQTADYLLNSPLFAGAWTAPGKGMEEAGRTYEQTLKETTKEMVKGRIAKALLNAATGTTATVAKGLMAGASAADPNLIMLNEVLGVAGEMVPGLNEKVITPLMSPVQTVFEPKSFAGKSGAEIIDVLVPMLAAHGGQVGRGLFDRIRKGKGKAVEGRGEIPRPTDRGQAMTSAESQVMNETMLPEFRNTQDAIAYGTSGNVDVEGLRTRMDANIAEGKRLLAEKNYQAASDIGLKSKLDREAIEASENKPGSSVQNFMQKPVKSDQPIAANKQPPEPDLLSGLLNELKGERENNLSEFAKRTDANDAAAERMRTEGKSEADIAEALTVKKSAVSVKKAIPTKYSQITENDYPVLSQVERISPDWIVNGDKVVMQEEFQGIDRSLLDLSTKPSLEELQRSGGVKFGNLDEKATEAGFDNAESFRQALLSEQERFNKYGYVSKQRIQDIADGLRDEVDPARAEETISKLPWSVQKQVRESIATGSTEKINVPERVSDLKDTEGEKNFVERFNAQTDAVRKAYLRDTRSKEVNAGDLKIGDKVKIYGEEFTVKEGDFLEPIKLEDGITFGVGPRDKIPVQDVNTTERPSRQVVTVPLQKNTLPRLFDEQGNLLNEGGGVMKATPSGGGKFPWQKEKIQEYETGIETQKQVKGRGSKEERQGTLITEQAKYPRADEGIRSNVPVEKQIAGTMFEKQPGTVTSDMFSGENKAPEQVQGKSEKNGSSVLLNVGLGAAAAATGKDDEDRLKRFLYGSLGGMILAGVMGRYSDTFRKLKQSEEGKVLVPVVKDAIKNIESRIDKGELKRSEAENVVMDELTKQLKGNESFDALSLPDKIRAVESLKDLQGTLRKNVTTSNQAFVPTKDVHTPMVPSAEGTLNKGRKLEANTEFAKKVSADVQPILNRLQEQVAERVNAGQLKPESAKIGLRKSVRDYVTFDEGRFLDKAQRDELIAATGAEKKLDDKVFAAETKAIETARQLEGTKQGTAKIVDGKFVDESVSGMERGILSKAVYDDVKGKIRSEVYNDIRYKDLTKEEKEQVLKTVERVYGERYKRAVNALMTEQYGMGKKGLEQEDGVFGQWNDIGPVDRNFIDMQRAFERAIPSNRMREMNRMYLEPLEKAKSDSADYQMKMLDELKREVVDKYGIKHDSKESELLQAYGEGYRIVNEKKGLMDYEERMQEFTFNDLVDEVGQAKAKQIGMAEKWFRTKYDEMLDAINETRKQIYGNDPEHQIMKRQDYFRHYAELTNGLGGLLNIFDMNMNIDPKLQGISEFTRPKSKWQGFAQRRFGWQTKQDAIGGFINYLPNAAHAIYMDPMITKFRKLSDALAEGTQSSKHMNNFIGYLREFTEQVAGKTNWWDRWTDHIGGRKALRALSFINNRVKSNIIIGNVSVAFGIGANVTLAAPELARYGRKAAVTTFTDSLRGTGEILKSRYLKQRYLGDVYEQFDTSVMGNAKRLGMWLAEQSDKWSTRLIWNTMYEKGKAIGVKDLIKFADRETKKMVPGGGVGETGYMLKSKTFQIGAPFQREVINTWYVLGDQVNAKQWGRLMGILAASYAFNRVMVAVRGSEVVFDPIQAFIDAARIVYDEEDKKAGLAKGAMRLAGEVVGNMPMGSTALSPFLDERQQQKYLGAGGGGRFGTGPGVLASSAKNIGKVVTGAAEGKLDLSSAGRMASELIPSWGGKQIEKSIRGGYAIANGAVYDKTGKLMFKIDEAPDQLKALLFGPYGTGAGKEYFEKKGEGKGETGKSMMKLPTINRGLPRLPAVPGGG